MNETCNGPVPNLMEMWHSSIKSFAVLLNQHRHCEWKSRQCYRPCSGLNLKPGKKVVFQIKCLWKNGKIITTFDYEDQGNSEFKGDYWKSIECLVSCKAGYQNAKVCKKNYRLVLSTRDLRHVPLS